MGPGTRRLVVVAHPADARKVSGANAGSDVLARRLEPKAGLKPYFYANGGGGAMLVLKTHPDSSCAKKVDTPTERERVYRDWYRRLPG
jgi:hypothetical protein